MPTDFTTPDACLGLIPGVSHACCGHGDVAQAYVVLGGEENADIDMATYRHVTLQGRDALTFFAAVKRTQIFGPGWQPE